MDDLTASVSDSTAPAEVTSPSGSDSASSPEPDTRSIAAELLRDTDAGDSTTAAPPAAPTSSEPPSTQVAANSDGADDAEYQNLLASGSMPVHRHQAVLTNARNKTRAEVEAEFRSRYGWVDEQQLDRARVEQATGLMRALEGPHKAHALRTLATALGVDLAPPPAPKEPEGPPPADLVTADGQEVYSAKQMAKWHDWQQQQYDKKLSAIEARFTPFLQKQQLGELREAANAEAGTTLAECRAQWPQFTALEGDIKARMTADRSLSLERAYIQAFASKGLPALQAQHDTDRASQLQRKAAASSAPPSAPRAVTPLRDRDRDTRSLAAEELARVTA
jgi:hypothetical protein